MLQVGRWTSIAMLAASIIPTPGLAEEPKPINQEQQSQNVTSRFMEGQLPNWHYGGFVDLGYSLDFNFPENHLFRNRSTTPRVNELDLNMGGVYVRKDATTDSRWGMELDGPRWPGRPGLWVWNEFAPRGRDPMPCGTSAERTCRISRRLAMA